MQNVAQVSALLHARRVPEVILWLRNSAVVCCGLCCLFGYGGMEVCLCGSEDIAQRREVRLSGRLRVCIG